VEKLARAAGVKTGTYLVGIRGYYHADHSDNQRGIYDDAIFLVTPQDFVSFNANVDPSVFRTGIAKLKAGVWMYQPGIHGLSKPKDRQYTALVQAAEVTVIRDGKGPDTGYFGINIHRGSHSSTSSLGCQTIAPQQWDAFISLVRRAINASGRAVIPYLLNE
jgi:lysozyme